MYTIYMYTIYMYTMYNIHVYNLHVRLFLGWVEDYYWVRLFLGQIILVLDHRVSFSRHASYYMRLQQSTLHAQIEEKQIYIYTYLVSANQTHLSYIRGKW